MTCKHCEARKRYTFTRGCRSCLVRWVNIMPKNLAREWLDKYQTEKGRPAMLELIDECKAAAELIELEAA